MALSRKLWNVVVVMLIYACTGTTAAFVSGRVSGLLGLERWSWSWWGVWLVVVFPLYNVLLLGFAAVFGRYQAFRARMTAAFRFLAAPFRRGRTLDA